MDSPVETQSFVSKLKSAITRINWKYVALGVGISFLIAPTPFLKLFYPFLKRIGMSYRNIQANQTKKIIFTQSQDKIDQILAKLQVRRSNVVVLNYSNVCKPQDVAMCQIWSKIIETQLNRTFSPYIVVLSNPQIIQDIEIRLYHMEEKERFKIQLIKDAEFHIISYHSKTFRLLYQTLEP